jgi:hypothetical protein
MKPIYYILDLLNTFQIYFSSHFYFVIWSISCAYSFSLLIPFSFLIFQIQLK